MAIHMRNGIPYGGIPNGIVSGETPSTVPTTVKQLNQVGAVGKIAPVTIPSAVKFSNGDTLETAIGSVATIETSPTVATHEVGEFIFYNGQMYRVIATIAVGETLTVDTNIEVTSVGAELTSLNNGLMSVDLLWENPNPTASFAPHTISLDLSTYDFVMVSGAVPDYNGQCFYSLCEIGKVTLLFAMTNSRHVRPMTVTGTGVNFGQGSKAGSPSQDVSVNNATMIPQKIWGIRF